MSTQKRHLDTVFERAYSRLLAYCRRRVAHNLGEPEDIVHVAYIKCCRSWDYNRSSRREETAYLFKAVRSVIADLIRQQARRQTRDRDRCRQQPTFRWESPLNHLAVLEVLESLPGRQLETCLAILSNRNLKQVLSDLDLSVNALSVNLHRARMAVAAEFRFHE